jgi:hypothetical protein
MLLHFKITGVVLIVLALVHLVFPKYFNWKNELTRLSLINKQMMQVHTLFIAVTVFLMGLLCITSAQELITTVLGRKVCLGFGAFWTLRLLVQFFGYATILWKGKLFETTVHIIFIILWAYLSVLFIMAGMQ